ncbi:MAG: helix-turn-helix domain-containing protein, partial [Gammaproteobacteria bacterium]|nr:helix-turn-helix domain-containing protein [Gammaproteobacteria bacterium]
MAEQLELHLSVPFASGTVFINGLCSLQTEGEHRALFVAGLPVHHYSVGDLVAEAYAMVMVVDGGFATQQEVARAFGISERTVRRHVARYQQSGMAALATRSGWRPGRRRLPAARRLIIERLKTKGLSNREIARRLGLTENAIRKQVGPSETRTAPLSQQPLLLGDAEDMRPMSAPGGEDDGRAGPKKHSVPDQRPETAHAVTTGEETELEEEPATMSLDVDPANRFWDRLLACAGLLDDAAPVFANACAVPGAAVLCAVPLLVASGIFELAGRIYGRIGPAFYGLRTILLTLLLMALWRIKRPEGLKEHDPQVLGRVLGLDRAPEVKTIRRKLTRLAASQKATQLGEELARWRAEHRGRLLGFLYIDGHVRVYHGKRSIPKAHVARMRLSMPATTDYWVNDQAGDPLFVVTAAANAGMVRMLPEILGEVRTFTGNRRLTVVFDRGGWSPKLFKKLLDSGFDILTYRKGKFRHIAASRFILRRRRIEGRRVEYRLHDQAVRLLNGTLRVRQVTRLADDGHQTAIITTRWDLADIDVAYRMFQRWRQENFFKYLRDEYLLDALVDYQVEPDDPTRTVPNPDRRALDKQVHILRAQLAKLEQAFGAAAADNTESRRPTMRGFKIAHGRLGKQLRAARQHLAELLAERRAVPQRIEVRDRTEGEVLKLATERKHLTNLIKMLAYQAESDLLSFLRANYARSEDEGRTLLHELFHAAADIDAGSSHLRLTIGPLSSPHRTLAVQTLCVMLSETRTTFPGSRMTMSFAVNPRLPTGLAFPGARQAAT